MTTFTVTGPDQKQYKIDAPAGATQEDANREVFRQHGWEMPTPPTAPAAKPGYQPLPWELPSLGEAAGGVGRFLGGVGQGVLDYPEGGYQLAEHLGAPRVPESVRAPLRTIRDWAQESKAGRAGEVVGGIGGAIGATLLTPEAAIPAALTRWAAANPGTASTITSALTSALQPVEGDNYWLRKAEDVGLGSILGRWFGRPAQQAGRDIAQAENVARAQANKADVAAALQGRQAQLTTRNRVPAETTAGWWDRTLKHIGASDPALARATPEAGSKVREVVGDRLNRIIGNMHLDPADPTFAERLNTVRDETRRALPESDQRGWFQPPPEQDLEPLFIHPTTGRPLQRTTRGFREAPERNPTGDFQRTVMEPLAKGPLTGRALTDYVSRLGDRAEELARQAAGRPEAERVSLQTRADALRDIQDAVIGHAAGSAEEKAELENARRAYMFWSVGNDAAKASRGGIAAPAQFIETLKRRLGPGGRGEARYKDALTNPQSPYHDVATWLQGQLERHRTVVPSAADVRAGVPPPRTPVDVPPAPDRPGRLRGTVGHAAAATALAAMGHPIWAAHQGLHAARHALASKGGQEGRILERPVRKALTRHPGATIPTAAGIGAAAAQVPKPTDPSSALQQGVEAAQKLNSWLRYGQ